MAAQRAKRIGRRMRERREELGLSQPEVATRIGVTSVTKDYVSRWELGKVEPSEAYLEPIADALETTVPDLMAGPRADRQTNGATPDLLEMSVPRSATIDAAMQNQLDHIEAMLKLLLDHHGLPDPLAGPGEGPLLSGGTAAPPSPKAATPKAGHRRSAPRP